MTFNFVYKIIFLLAVVHALYGNDDHIKEVFFLSFRSCVCVLCVYVCRYVDVKMYVLCVLCMCVFVCVRIRECKCIFIYVVTLTICAFFAFLLCDFQFSFYFLDSLFDYPISWISVFILYILCLFSILTLKCVVNCREREKEREKKSKILPQLVLCARLATAMRPFQLSHCQEYSFLN